jgi:hypothetical protein
MTRSPIKLIHRIASVFAIGALFSGVACSSSEDAASTEGAIIAGQVDTTHEAVVLLQIDKGDGTGARCSGTIIKADPVTKVGYVLTAAHCVDDAAKVYITAADDVSLLTQARRYQVIDFKAHPNYHSTSSPYDVGMVRILGVDANTPVIPLLSPDNLAVGMPVNSVGFGRTTNGTAPQENPNTLRRSVKGTIRRVSAGTISVVYQGGSICHGDSGGPMLVTQNGKEYVGAVHSFVMGDCIGYAGNSRPSAFMSFIQPILTAPPPSPTCAICKQTANSGDQKCAADNRACLADANCGGFYRCIVACTDADCGASCRAQFPLGIGPFNALRNCPCNECASACGEDTTCANVPKCGIPLGDSDCGTCLQNSCCSEVAACGSDGACYACLNTPAGTAPAPECATNALRKAMFTCRTDKCATQCAPHPAADAGAPAPATP